MPNLMMFDADLDFFTVAHTVCIACICWFVTQVGLGQLVAYRRYSGAD